VPTDTPSTTPTFTPSISQSPTTCVSKVNLCFALDMSGSICNGSTSSSCSNCPNSCHEEDLFDQDTCCSNFAAMKSFSSAIVNALAEETDSRAFSVVEFAATATSVIGLSSSSEATQELEKLAYSGGGTNHAAAITACQETLDQSTDNDRENAILLITDGVATRPSGNPFQSAEVAADLAKEAGTMLVPVFVGLQTQEHLDYMAGLSSDGQVADVTDFAELSSLIESLVPKLACSSSVPTDTRSATPTFTPSISQTPSTSSGWVV